MTRKPGAMGGRIVGPHSDLRARRAQQRASRSTGDNFGGGLELDDQGRMRVRPMPRIDDTDPDALSKLLAYLREYGFMER